MLVLTFAGGDWLNSHRTRTTVEDQKAIDQIPIDPFRTTPYKPSGGLIPQYVVAVICGIIGCILMIDLSLWGRWIGMAFSLLGIGLGIAQVVDLTGVRLYKRAGIAAIGLILSATAGTFHIWVSRGIAPY